MQKNRTKEKAGREQGIWALIKCDLTALGNLRLLCFSALLAAMGVVLGVMAKLIFGEGPLRITFENLPIIFGGISFGPLVGAVIALVADLCSCLYAGQAPYPLITVGSMCIGFLAGVVGRYLLRRGRYLSLLITELIAHGVGSVLLKSWALYTFGYAWPLLLPRIPIYIAIATLEALVLHMLFSNRSFLRMLQTLDPAERGEKP